MQSRASTVAQYLAELPPDRRAAVEAVRAVFKANLDSGYEEGMQYGMIGYYVPHRIFPAGYHCDPKQPLPFAGLASQKNHLSVYLMGCYGPYEETFRAAWAKTGKKLDMGKCCVRFKRVEDLALDVIADTLKRFTVANYVGQYLSLLAASKAAKGKAVKAPKAAKGRAAAKAKPKPRSPKSVRKAAKKAGR